ncbi:hypothetical protein LUZ60_016698 [Juncus effusus]|nr:hypothetical protein LUZ60_016698 [Juncus effusus]
MMAVWTSPLPKSLTKIQPSVSILYTPSLTLLSKKQRIPLNHFFNACSSPLLENSPTDLQPISLKQSPVTDFIISNKLIRSLCEDPQTETLALEYYKKAREKQNLVPNSKTLTTLFTKLLKSKQWVSLAYLIEDLKSLDVIPFNSTCSKLVMACIKGKKFKLMESFLRVLETREGDAATSAFSSAMRGYNKLHMYNSTILVFNYMRDASQPLDSECHRSMMEACNAIGNTNMVLSLFHEYKCSKFDPNNGATEIYTVVCDSLAKGGKAVEALRCMREMEKEGLNCNSSIYSSLISSFIAKKEVIMVEDLYNEALEKGMMKDPDIFLKLILMYVEIGLMEKTITVVKEMNDAGVRVSDCISCAVVNGFAKKRGLKPSIRAYNQLISVGCEPGQVTYSSILNICCRLGYYQKAELIFSEMIEKGFDKCLIAYSNMISMYGKNGRASEAMKLLAKMKQKGCQPNVYVYNSLLDMHGRLMKVRQVEKLWKEMQRRKIKPDKISYTSAISAYSRVGELDECMRLYKEYKSSGGKVDRVLAGIMVGVYSRNSRYDELIEFLREVKQEGTELDRRLYDSVMNRFNDAELRVHARWLQNNFGFTEDKT